MRMSGELDNQTAQEYMEAMLGHYLYQHKIILRQLEHVQKATLQGIEDIKKIRRRFEIKQPLKQFDNVSELGRVWGEVLRLAQNSGLDEEDLAVIEKILSKVPIAIRDDYERLVGEDKELNEMIETVNSEDYNRTRQEAMSYAETKHKEVNEIMGVDDSEYDEIAAQAILPAQKDRLEKVYKILQDEVL